MNNQGNNWNDNRSGGGFYPEQEIKRTYTPEEAGHERQRKPVSRFRHRRHRPPNPGVVLILLVFAVVFGVCIYMLASGRSRPVSEEDFLQSAVSTNDSEASPIGGNNREQTLTLTEDQVHTGDLILVNYAYPYTFPADAEAEITSVSTFKNDKYYVRDNTSKLRRSTIEKFNILTDAYYAATGFSGMQVNSGYRSYQEQVDLYASYVSTNGEEYAKAYVANPGYSEHHTGLAMDLNVYVKGEGIYYVESYDKCAWYRENCEDYGFILRYPSEKVYITGINYESWHYRYVGTPHSLIMEERDLCLEEYIDFLKSYTCDGTRLLYNTETGTSAPLDVGESYEKGILIYYVQAQPGETKCTVPADCTYTVSGNNVDGFIITAEKKAS
ncbi:D-alanyl-D-alanine carboxypeptidase [Clostridiales bacterium]|nr:D-alanyl-D-alanine carboxypeptidase [Clostridiales bacterium]